MNERLGVSTQRATQDEQVVCKQADIECVMNTVKPKHSKAHQPQPHPNIHTKVPYYMMYWVGGAEGGQGVPYPPSMWIWNSPPCEQNHIDNWKHYLHSYYVKM